MTRENTASGIYSLLLTAVLFGFPIVSAIPVVLGSPSRPISIVYRGAISLLSVMALVLWTKLDRPIIDRFFRLCAGIFASILLLRMFWEWGLASLPLDLPWSDYCLQIVGITLVPVLPFLIVPEWSWVGRAHKVSLWVGVAAAIAIILSVLLSIRSFAGGSRLMTDVLNPISIGAAGVSLYIVGSTLQTIGSPFKTAFRIAAAMLGIGICLMSASKGPLLELAIVIAIQFGIPGRKLSVSTRIFQSIAMLMLVGAATAGAIWASGNRGLALLSRLADLGAQQSVTERVLLWRGALTEFNNSPFLGSSFVELMQRSYPHNDFLESMMTSGIAGLLLFVALLLVGSVSANQVLRNPESRWLALLFLQQVIGEQSSGSLYFNQPFWATLFIVIATDKAMKSDSQQQTLFASVQRDS